VLPPPQEEISIAVKQTDTTKPKRLIIEPPSFFGSTLTNLLRGVLPPILLPYRQHEKMGAVAGSGIWALVAISDLLILKP
jgi:hypothetical protein